MVDCTKARLLILGCVAEPEAAPAPEAHAAVEDPAALAAAQALEPPFRRASLGALPARRQLEWTQKLGDAFVADQADVMARVQFLRDKAEHAGNLKSNKHQTVRTERIGGDEYVYIEPTDPEVIYVPTYESAVYGTWWFPDYPPYYWEPADVVYVDDFFWGAGFAVAPSLWAWSRPRWHRHYIHISPRKYNRLHRHERKLRSDRWRHDARHRRGVKYKDARSWRKGSKAAGRSARGMRLRTRDDDGKRLVKPDGDRRLGARNMSGPRVKSEGKRHRDAARSSLGERRAGDRPRASKRPKPEKRVFSGPKKRSSASTVKKRRQKAGRSTAGSKKQRASRVKKRSSAGVKQRSLKAFSKSRKRSSARKFSRARGSGVNVRRGGRKAGARSGGRRGGKGGRRGGGRRR